jgi:hypothetical protein
MEIPFNNLEYRARAIVRLKAHQAVITGRRPDRNINSDKMCGDNGGGLALTQESDERFSPLLIERGKIAPPPPQCVPEPGGSLL